MVLINPKEGLEYSMDGYLVTLLTHFKDAVHNHNTSAVFIIDGRSGMGKTTLAIQIATMLYPTFDLKHVYFTPESFLEGLAAAEQFSVHVFDEAMILSNRSTMSQINKMIVQAMSMIRSKNIFIIFNINSVFDLDKNLALSRADLLLHVYGDNLIDRGNFAAFFKSKGQEDRLKQLYLLGKKYYSYSKPKANFYGSFTSRFILDKEEYEKAKQIGINEFLKAGSKPSTKKEMVEARLIKYLKEEVGLSPEEIADIGNISRATVFNKINLVPKEE